MEINARSISIRSKDLVGISGALELGQDVIVIVQGEVIEIKEVNNHNGTKDLIYIIKGAIAKKYEPGT